MPDFGAGTDPNASANVFPAALNFGHPDMIMQGAGTAAAAAVTTNNRIWYIPFLVHRIVTITRIGLLNGGTVAGNVEVGIYNEAGVQLVTSGAVAQSGTNAAQIYDITDTVLTPGLYYVAIVTSNATATLFRWNAAMLATNSTAVFTSLAAGSASASLGILVQATGTLPATATFAAPSVAQDDSPPFVTLFRTAI